MEEPYEVIERFGDETFELYQRHWIIMTRDYTLCEHHLVCFMNRLFERDVLKC